MDLIAIKALVAADLKQLDETISAQFNTSDIDLITQLNSHIFNSGGKRLRPLLTILCARACHYQGDAHCQLACVVELVHTATLLHDDVVDQSDKRRNQPTANSIWGNSASVLVGDYLYSRAMTIMAELGHLPIIGLLAAASNRIAEGEVMQLTHLKRPDTSEAQYFEIITNKTARLFSAACDIAGVISQASPHQCQALANYGNHLGIAFQLIDDKLDYDGDSEQIGKNIGDDLAEGKPTLPLITALNRGDATQQQFIKQCILNGTTDPSTIRDIIQICQQTGALEYTEQCAIEHSEKAISQLGALDDSPFKTALQSLAQRSVSRQH